MIRVPRRLRPAIVAVLLAAYASAAPAFNDTTANGGIAVRGDVSNSTLNVYSRDPADVKAIADALANLKTEAAARHDAEQRAEKLAIEAQTTKQQMLVFLSILAMQDIKPEQVAATMAEIARNYQRQQDNYATLAPQDPGAVDLVRQARQATEAGRFDDADRLLAQAVDRETAAVTEHRMKVAELTAARGDNAATQLHHADAAQYYEAAADQWPRPGQRPKAIYLFQAGDLRQIIGNLAMAMVDYRAAHAIFDGLAKASPGNADAQRDLSVSHERHGDVLLAQGNLTEALAAYRSGLAIREASGAGRPGQRRLAARSLGLAQQARRRSRGAGQPDGSVDRLPRRLRDHRASGAGGPGQRRLAAGLGCQSGTGGGHVCAAGQHSGGAAGVRRGAGRI